MSILGDITPEEFLRDYWQKKPLVIRDAFADFEMPFDAGELAGLVCETDAPSRIILEKGLAPDHKPWTSKHSPFTDEDFINTPESHWTFLVNDLERYIPELGNLIEPFRFIPDWRIDDLMVSYAADQGSVGPHVDQYDVFLIQGEGKRRWQVITDPNYPKELQKADLAILENFEHDEEWLLDKGDMLYLPPNMPHHGVAEGECFTFSVGFRAPDTLDLTQSWIESFGDLVENGIKNSDSSSETTKLINKRFDDKNRKLQINSGEITSDDIQKLSKQIMDLVKNQEKELPIFLGKFLTESKNTDQEEQPSSSKLSITLDYDKDYERESWIRIAYMEQADAIHLFAAGHHIALPHSEKAAIQAFCEHFYYSAKSLKPLFEYDEFKLIFKGLLKSGSLFTE